MRWFFSCVLLVFSCCSCAQPKKSLNNNKVIPGAEQTGEYFQLLRHQRIAVFANQTSMIGDQHLVDSMQSYGLTIIKIFSPEHGFRGKADAGEEIKNSIDKKTGIRIVSLYGNHKKPNSSDLQDVDVVVFDIQDVGVRFYTYISSLQYLIEACIEFKKPLLILDRPNPNGFYVDGPVLETEYKSFIGMQPIPIVYGMTMGEYARMLIGENWLNINSDISVTDKVTTHFTAHPFPPVTVIKCKNYNHLTLYRLPVAPSPNLRDMKSIYLYPSTCFFEGTVLSEGRGTDRPFQLFGHPNYPKTMYHFIPKPNEGAKSGKCFYQDCYGWSIEGTAASILHQLDRKIDLNYLLEAYRLFPGKDSFFLKNNFFNKLAGNDQLIRQVKSGMSEVEIRKSWEPGLIRFKAIRKKYLFYPDFE